MLETGSYSGFRLDQLGIALCSQQQNQREEQARPWRHHRITGHIAKPTLRLHGILLRALSLIAALPAAAQDKAPDTPVPPFH